MRYDIATLKSRLGAIRTDDNPAILKQKSRDFYWTRSSRISWSCPRIWTS